jgi:hypothetical protein
MSFIQFEVWGVVDGHEELIECVGTLKEAEIIAETEQEFHDEIWILEDTDEDLREVRRYKGL